METVQQKIAVDMLALGMYVSELDKPWLGTPFKLQGFLIRDDAEIEELRQHCQHVYVDIAKGKDSVESRHTTLPTQSSGREQVIPAKYAFTPVEVRHGTYREHVKFDQEAKAVTKLNTDIDKVLISITDQVSRGVAFDQKPLKNAAGNIVSSVIRNPDVIAWLTRVRLSDDYLHHHSIRCSIWAALLGRHIGLRRLDLELLTQAILMKDIGKTRLPESILAKDERELNSEQRVIYRKHVAMALQLVKQIDGVNPKIYPIIGAHRERYDGTGYPRHLKGDNIPLLAIIAGIATYYDELTNPRDIRLSIAPSTAVTRLYDKRNIFFQEDVVVEFIQSLGLYPAGSVVELNTGELAVVVEQFAERRLRPRIVIATDENKAPIVNLRSFDLLEEALAPQEKKTLDKKSKRFSLPLIYIVRDLEPEEFPIDLLKIKEKLFIPNRKTFGFFSFKS
ncbi:MAG: DUF3391 domain-containing protein [Pseudomonadales bacterium]|nr:DUF3391 domain-containing protein [Pseudomonadales bacterium]